MEMKLRIFSPIGVILETPVQQIDFESINGFFTLLPKHTDIISALKIGIITYKTNDTVSYVACNKGVLVKKNDTVSVSTKMAILGTDLKTLEEKITTDFKMMEEERKEINTTMAKLEISLAKGIMSLKNIGENNVGI